MVTFNQLEITRDRKNLIIEVSVPESSGYDSVTISSITIDNQDTFNNNAPSTKGIAFNNATLEVFDPDFALNKKHLRIELTNSNLSAGSFSLDDLLFVYVETDGTMGPEVPCEETNPITLGTVVDVYPFYQKAMNYIKELANSCSINNNFVDYILKLKGLEISIATGNYTEATKLFKKFDSKYNAVNGGCGCGN